MQAAGNLVTVAVEFPAGVQHRHDDLGCGTAGFILGVDAGGDTPPVVHDADGIVGMDDDFNFVAVSGQRLIDRVIENLEHHVMQAGPVARITDVHAGAFAYRFQALENLDAVGIVFR